ncbi:MAG: nucleoside hydrolase [Lentisphaeria bacterium]
MNRIPVILDTDLGTDIDDSWALAMLLKSPELDLKLVSAAAGDTRYRAAIAARMLSRAGRADIPVAIGRDTGDPHHARSLLPWVAGYQLEAYPNLKPDAAAAIVETVMRSPQPVTVIGIAPLTNIGDALALEPRIAQKARFVGMQGSVAVAYDGQPGVAAEWNVVRDVAAAQRTFAAPWPKTITPLDSCGDIILDAAFCQQMAASRDPLCRDVWESWQVWRAFQAKVDSPAALPPPEQTSVLFDTVAVFLAFSRQWLQMKTLDLIVTDDGFTREDPAGQPVDVALGWNDKPAFLEFLKQRLAP